MPHQLKAFAFLSSLAVAALLAAGSVPANADERCTGTLCDLYYGSSPDDQAKPAAKPAAPTPIMVPKNGVLGYFSNGGSAQATAPSDASGTPTTGPMSRVHIGGGGLLGMARGETPERCSGTICDLYYGGPPPEKSQAPAAAAAAQPAPDAAQPAADAVADAAQPSRQDRLEFVEIQRERQPQCAPTAQDPWRCYRK